MQSLQELAAERTLELDTSGRSPRWRDEYIDAFTEGVNLDRVGTKYKPLSKAAIAVKIAHLGPMDLHYLLKRCNEGVFGKVFFGALKPKPAL